jgi:hypothetical protein
MSRLSLPCSFFIGASLFFAARAEAQLAPKPRRASVAYFGESVVNPGAVIGYEATFYYRRPHELFGGAHIGGYNSSDPPYYGLLIYIEGGYRLNFNIGFFLEARAGLGYVNVNRAQVITQVDGGTMQGPNISSNALTPIGLAGLGWDLLPRTRVPVSIFADVGGMGRYTQNEAFAGGLIFTTGIAYQFGTGRVRTADTEVPPTPPPVAPSNLDSPLPPGVVNDVPPTPPGAIEPMPPPDPMTAPPAQPQPPEPPQLPPPPTVPGL